jgi:hypothetical protein
MINNIMGLLNQAISKTIGSVFTGQSRELKNSNNGSVTQNQTNLKQYTDLRIKIALPPNSPQIHHKFSTKMKIMN